MTDSTSPGELDAKPDRRYVLRLLVVKIEGVLVDPPTEWSLNDVPPERLKTLNPDELFPDWCDQLEVSDTGLRRTLVDYAESGSLRIEPELRSLLDSTRNHSPVRVAFLSSGPEEWVRALEKTYHLEELRDLSFCYDNYRHGSRRTLLQFLMNRFIAGKGRTLLLGRTPADELLANKEKTRFRSLEPPPNEALEPDNWNWTPERLRSFMEEKQPEG